MEHNNYNQQNTQTYFNLGLDFLVISSTFKDIAVPQNFNHKKLFKITIKL